MRFRGVFLIVVLAIGAVLVGCAPDSSNTPDSALVDGQTSSPAPGPTNSPTPVPSKTVGVDPAPNLNAVDNADYVSHAVAINYGAVPGVEFSAVGGEIICGITGEGSEAEPGWAYCKPSSWHDIIAQPSPEASVYSVVAIRGERSTYAYPDMFSQPARSIPVLSAGTLIAYEGMTCQASDSSVTCSDDGTGYGFTVSITAITLF